MDSRTQYCLVLITVSILVVDAEIGGVYLVLKYQLRHCLCKPSGNYLQSCFTQQQFCLKSSIFRCLMFHEPCANPRNVTRPVCGVINMGNQLMSHTWHITVLSTFGLQINFLKFYLPMSPNCQFGTKVIVNTAHNNSKNLFLIYCGDRVPWHLSFPQPHATIKCDTESIIPQGFSFVMTFEAFDIALSSVVQLNQIQLHAINVFHVKTKYRPSTDFTFAILRIGQEGNFVKTEVRIHILVTVLCRIVLQSTPDIFSQITIYNGPGILSPIIAPSAKSTQLNLFSYQAYIKYSVMLKGNVTEKYNEARNQSYSNRSNLTWMGLIRYFNKDCKLGEDLSRNPQIHVPQHRSRETSVFAICLIKFSTIITIHRMTFTGFNMLLHSPSTISLSATCQYGGLFVLGANGTEYLKLCADVRPSFTIPFNAFEGPAGGGGPEYIVFATFHGYSSGSLHLTSGKDHGCSGLNIEFSRGPSCNNYITIWDDLYWRHYIWSSQPQSNCTDVWIMNDIDYFDPSPFENCTFVLDPDRVEFLTGSIKIITSVSFSISYPSASLVNSQRSVLPGDMNVELDMLKDIHRRTTTRASFSAPFLTQNEYEFNSVGRIVFKINFSVYDKFPAFAIRIQILTQTKFICHKENTIYNRYSPYPPYFIYRMENSNVDVYLPRDHPYSPYAHHNSLMYKYNRGMCRVLIIGQVCSCLVSHYDIIQIHYYPHKSLISPHEINISFKKTLNCSIKCSLDVGIFEYMDTDNQRKLRYHEWRGIYHLTWQVIAAKSRGFSVTINSTCEACTKLCDVAVILGLPLKSNHILNSSFSGLNYVSYVDYLDSAEKRESGLTYATFERILFELTRPVQEYRLQSAVYGSWNDAHAYCVSQNFSLFTLTPSLTSQLQRMDLEDGWKYPHEQFFAGLYRDNMVSITDIEIQYFT